jgi:hypothetical protein
MAVKSTSLRDDILKIIAWSAIFPALAFWPFLSAFPALALWDGAASNLVIAIHAIFFVTGFWSMAAIVIIFWVVLSDAARTQFSAGRKQLGLVIGCYANLWTALYIIAAIGLSD